MAPNSTEHESRPSPIEVDAQKYKRIFIRLIDETNYISPSYIARGLERSPEIREETSKKIFNSLEDTETKRLYEGLYPARIVQGLITKDLDGQEHFWGLGLGIELPPEEANCKGLRADYGAGAGFLQSKCYLSDLKDGNYSEPRIYYTEDKERNIIPILSIQIYSEEIFRNMNIPDETREQILQGAWREFRFKAEIEKLEEFQEKIRERLIKQFFSPNERANPTSNKFKDSVLEAFYRRPINFYRGGKFLESQWGEFEIYTINSTENSDEIQFEVIVTDENNKFSELLRRGVCQRIEGREGAYKIPVTLGLPEGKGKIGDCPKAAIRRQFSEVKNILEWVEVDPEMLRLGLEKDVKLRLGSVQMIWETESYDFSQGYSQDKVNKLSGKKWLAKVRQELMPKLTMEVPFCTKPPKNFKYSIDSIIKDGKGGYVVSVNLSREGADIILGPGLRLTHYFSIKDVDIDDSEYPRFDDFFEEVLEPKLNKTKKK